MQPDHQTRFAHDLPLDDQIARVESRIREQPTNASHRWALFQLLCVTGDWPRALQQLQIWAKLDSRQARTAHAYRELIRAERWRAKVMDGEERPGFVLEPPPWARKLAAALRLAANGQSREADDAREAALDAAPLVKARIPTGCAAWIADSDSRIGPVCEVMTAGHYRWVPFADLATWRLVPPASLIDLVWAPCVLTLIDGGDVRGFMPARYPGSETQPDPLRVGRETVWREAGRTGVIALGQKTWTTAAGDFGLFELLEGAFGIRAAQPEEPVHGPA